MQETMLIVSSVLCKSSYSCLMNFLKDDLECRSSNKYVSHLYAWKFLKKIWEFQTSNTMQKNIPAYRVPIWFSMLI